MGLQYYRFLEDAYTFCLSNYLLEDEACCSWRNVPNALSTMSTLVVMLHGQAKEEKGLIKYLYKYMKNVFTTITTHLPNMYYYKREFLYI